MMTSVIKWFTDKTQTKGESNDSDSTKENLISNSNQPIDPSTPNDPSKYFCVETPTPWSCNSTPKLQRSPLNPSPIGIPKLLSAIGTPSPERRMNVPWDEFRLI